MDAEASDHVVPAAVLAIEIVGQFGKIEELIRVLVGIVEPAEYDVRPAADVGGDRRLGTDVFEILCIHAHRHAGQLREFRGIGRPLILVALYEALPAQDAQFRSRFGFVAQFGGLRGERSQQAPGGAGNRARTDHLEGVPTRKLTHAFLP